eukprot:scaffold105015_cov47-Attheya_sp.AAC.2
MGDDCDSGTEDSFENELSSIGVVSKGGGANREYILGGGLAAESDKSASSSSGSSTMSCSSFSWLFGAHDIVDSVCGSPFGSECSPRLRALLERGDACAGNTGDEFCFRGNNFCDADRFGRGGRDCGAQHPRATERCKSEVPSAVVYTSRTE